MCRTQGYSAQEIEMPSGSSSPRSACVSCVASSMARGAFSCPKGTLTMGCCSTATSPTTCDASPLDEDATQCTSVGDIYSRRRYDATAMIELENPQPISPGP
ncbi:UNVERIFIED_CONTAM: hypothetical protein HHA_449110 [Hammondia hammondi]|eukprot:XP_008881683.1 hypothetical protein HHA_449110 [Hammondia hammondi]